MDFEQRLEKAIERGQRRGDAQSEEQARAAHSEEEFKRLHGQYRLELSDHIEESGAEGCLCLSKSLANETKGPRQVSTRVVF